MAKLALTIGLALAAAGCAVPPPAVSTAPGTASATPGETACRDYTAQALIDGRMQPIVGRTCRLDDGTWRIAEGPPDRPTLWTRIYTMPHEVWYPFYPAWWWEPPIGFALPPFFALDPDTHFHHSHEHSHAGHRARGGMHRG